MNIVGIPALSEFFDDGATGPDATAEDNSTTILSSGKRSHFFGDHGRHNHHFTHPDSTLPSLSLFQGTGYFSAFCSRVESVYSDRIHFAFSSAYSLKPSPNVVSDDETSPESDSEDEDEWFSPTPSAKDDHPD